MTLIHIFILLSFISFLISIFLLSYFSILKKNPFSYSLKRVVEGEKIGKEEFKNLLIYSRKFNSKKKLWFSHRILEEARDYKYKDISLSFLKSYPIFLQSAIINYLGALKEENAFKELISFLKEENLLKFHCINALKEISLKNFNLFKENFEKEPNLLLPVALELFIFLEREKQLELFLLIKKYFASKEKVLEKILPFLENFASKEFYEEVLYQLDIFPLSFQEEFIKIFTKNMEIQNYIPFFDLKFKTSPEKNRYIYIYPFALYYSEKKFEEAIEFFNLLKDKEKEIFIKEFFPEPENFINFFINIKSSIPENSFDIILEKLSLLQNPETLKILENLLNLTKNKDRFLFKFFNLILDWREEEIKKILLWVLAKIENPIYREKIYLFVKEKKFDF